MKSRMILFFGAVLALGSRALGLQVLEPGYTVGDYVSLSAQYTHDIAFDGAGNMYLTLSEEDTIARVARDKSITYWRHIPWPVQVVWTGGTQYGQYLYVTCPGDLVPGVMRITAAGTVSGIIPVRQADGLGLDTTGRYQGSLFVGTDVADRIDRLMNDGSVRLFSDFPYNMSGCVEAIEIDRTGRYGGLMYVATSSAQGVDPTWSGLHTLDAWGSPIRFAPKIVGAYELAFAPAGCFGRDLFVVGTSDFSQWSTIWRVKPDGTATVFARTADSMPYGLAFGPDGAMYVGEVSVIPLCNVVTIYRIVPEPTTLLLLGFGVMMLRKKH